MDFAAVLEEEKGTEVLTPVTTYSIEAVKPQITRYLVEVERMASDATAIEVTDPDREKFAVALGGQAKKLAKAIKAKEEELTRDAKEYVKNVGGLCDLFLDRLVYNPKKTNTECIEALLKKKIGDYQNVIELRRREQEAAARKAQQELQDRLNREAEEANRKAREEAMKKAQEEAEAKRLAAEAEAKERGAKKAEMEALARKAEEERLEAMRKAEEEAKAREITAPVVPDPIVPVQATTVRAETGASSYQVKRWVCEVLHPDEVPRSYCEPSKKLLDDAVKMGVRNIPGCKIEEITETRIRT